MVQRALRLLLVSAALGCTSAADKELEAQMTQLEQELLRNQREIKALEKSHSRRLSSSIFGTGASGYDAQSDFKGAMTHAYLIICGSLVMFMQAGFALLEAGVCRKKFVQNILLKNLTDVAIGTLGWWIFGYSFAFSGPTVDEGGTSYKENQFVGGEQFLAHHFAISRPDGQIEPSGNMLTWFFQWAFASAAATIVSGGVAERVKFPGYCIYSFLLTSWVYPCVVAWTWGYGFFSSMLSTGYMDFAGSGIVHLVGGIGALTGAIIAGPRVNRFKGKMFSFEPPLAEDEVDEYAPHSQPLVVLGTLILWFGWYGFNCGSVLTMESADNGFKAAHVAMTTTISAAFGGLTVFCLRYVLIKKYDVGAFCNGILAGLVSITAPCSNVDTGSAIIIGILGGILFQGASSTLRFLKIDDPLDAFAVHGMCGMWGVIAAALFDWGHAFSTVHGWSGFACIMDSSTNKCMEGIGGELLAVNIAEVACISLWTAVWSTLIFGILKFAGFLVASPEEQNMGFDEAKHSPSKAYDYSQTGASASSGAGAEPAEDNRGAMI